MITVKMDPAAILAATEAAAVTVLEWLPGAAMYPSAVHAAAAATAAIMGMQGTTPNPAVLAAAQAAAMAVLGGQALPAPVVFEISPSLVVTGILDLHLQQG
jgi:hypothetical protein